MFSKRVHIKNAQQYYIHRTIYIYMLQAILEIGQTSKRLWQNANQSIQIVELKIKILSISKTIANIIQQFLYK